MAVDGDAVVLFGVPVVALIDDDRVVAQPQPVELQQNAADVVVGRGNGCGVGAPRLGHRLVALAEAFQRLLRIVRNVERNINEERAVLIALDEREGAVDHQVGKIPAAVEDFADAFVKIVVALAVKKVVRVVFDEAVADAEELVETLLGRPMVAVAAEMPLAEESVCGSPLP